MCCAVAPSGQKHCKRPVLCHCHTGAGSPVTTPFKEDHLLSEGSGT